MEKKVPSDPKKEEQAIRSDIERRYRFRVTEIRPCGGFGEDSKLNPLDRLSLGDRMKSFFKYTFLRFFELVGLEFEDLEVPTSHALNAAYKRQYALEREVLLQKLRILSLKTDLGVEMIRREGVIQTLCDSGKPLHRNGSRTDFKA